MTIQQIDIIAQVSVFLNDAPCTLSETYSHWVLKGRGGEFMIDFEDNIFKFVDFGGDIKTYFALVGLATLRDFTYGDYFTEKENKK